MDEAMVYLLLIVAGIFSLVAQMKVHAAYSKYSKILNKRGLSGAEVAQDILERNNYDDVSLGVSRGGSLSDHFDPRTKTVNLSPNVYNGKTVAAIAIAAHECGHVVQHETGFRALTVRNSLLPAMMVASSLGWVVMALSIYLEMIGLFYVGVALIGVTAVYHLITLPIERNASARALAIVNDYGYISEDEKTGVKKVLDAAALTYIAAFIMSLLNVLRLLLIARRRD